MRAPPRPGSPSARLNEGLPQKGKRSDGRLPGPVPVRGASMKGFPRRGSDALRVLPVPAHPHASMKGFPRRGSDTR